MSERPVDTQDGDIRLVEAEGATARGEVTQDFAPAIQAGEACGHGTKIHFVDTPKEAAAQAKKEQKLVFVLHVSGHFEDPGLT